MAKGSPETAHHAPPYRVVGMLSTYREGQLARTALRTLAAVNPDHIYIYEGPAGPPLSDDIPPTDLGELPACATLHNGRWRTDARKRQTILEHAKRDYPGVPLFGITIDGDEALINGEYVRDILQAILWNDEGADAPTIRFPIRTIEPDGSVAMAGPRIQRLDLIQKYEVGQSAIVNVHGVREGHGNLIAQSSIPLSLVLDAIDRGREACWPPFPCEPHIFHRSYLRHPARRAHRLHQQEAVELRRLGIS